MEGWGWTKETDTNVEYPTLETAIYSTPINFGLFDYLAPIEIEAITLGPIVISRDKIGQVTKNHEAIHFQQYLETLFIGFLLVYLWDWLMGLFKYRDGHKAYVSIRAEQEAYRHQQDLTYLQTGRRRSAWLTE